MWNRIQTVCLTLLCGLWWPTLNFSCYCTLRVRCWLSNLTTGWANGFRQVLNWIPSSHVDQVPQLSQRVSAHAQPTDRNQIAVCIQRETMHTHAVHTKTQIHSPAGALFIISGHYCCRRLTFANNNSSCSFQHYELYLFIPSLWLIIQQLWPPVY